MTDQYYCPDCKNGEEFWQDETSSQIWYVDAQGEQTVEKGQPFSISAGGVCCNYCNRPVEKITVWGADALEAHLNESSDQDSFYGTKLRQRDPKAFEERLDEYNQRERGEIL